MSDMQPIQELTNDRLAEIAAKPTDLEAAKDKVFDLETRLTAAKSAHSKNFPHDDRTMNPKCQESLQAIDRIADAPRWAQRRLDLIQRGQDLIELQRARGGAGGFLYFRSYQ